ncbi:12263_t:CDS:2, partial [Gigaspora rosea]
RDMMLCTSVTGSFLYRGFGKETFAVGVIGVRSSNISRTSSSSSFTSGHRPTMCIFGLPVVLSPLLGIEHLYSGVGTL